MAKVVLVGINYAPELTGIGMNTAAMARSLTDAGHSVEVITGFPHYPEWRVPRPYRARWRMTEALDGVPVRRFRHYVPHRHFAVTRAVYELTFVANAILTQPSQRPDAVIGVTPSLGGALLARVYAARFHAALGLVFSDLMGRAASQSGMPGGGSVAAIVGAAELRMARAAAAVAVIADGFRPYLEAGGVSPSRIYRIVNLDQVTPAAAPRSRGATRQRLGWGRDDVVVLHTGNMGYKQSLDTLIVVASLSRHDARYRFVLMGDGNRRRSLEKLTRRLGLTNVDFRSLAPADEYPAILEAADILILNQRASVKDMSLPGKLVNYLASGTPVIAAVAPDSEAARELRRSPGSILVQPENPGALVAAIERIADRPTRPDDLRLRGGSYLSSRIASAAELDVNSFLEILLSSQRK